MDITKLVALEFLKNSKKLLYKMGKYNKRKLKCVVEKLIY